MADPNDGNSQPAGGQQSPTGATSGDGSQLSTEYVKRLESQVAELTTMVKGIQKGTDKQIGQVRSDVKRILELKEQGLNESQIQRELFLDGLMNQNPESQNAPVPTPAGSGTPNTSLDVESVIKSLQFPDNDPTLAALRIKHAGNTQALLQAAAEFRLSQAAVPQPSTGTLPSQTGASGGNNLDAQLNELNTLLLNPTKNRARIADLQKTLDERGWK